MKIYTADVELYTVEFKVKVEPWVSWTMLAARPATAVVGKVTAARVLV